MTTPLPLLVVVAVICVNFAPGIQSEREKRMSLNPFAFATDLASSAIDSVGLGAINPIKIGSQLTGMAMGGMGLVWGKQENKKCYYYWGLGFSGPDSWNPSRWNGAKWDKEEEGGLMNGVSDAIGVGFTAFFQSWETEEARAQTCKMLGMGYKEQQPGFPSKPGTCPEGPNCFGPPGHSNQPRPGTTIPGSPGSTMVYTIPGHPGEVQPGTPGAVITIITPGQPPMYIPGTPDTITTQTYPGQPGQYIPGTPPSQQFITTQQGQPPHYIPGSPPTQQVITHPGSPPQMIPGTPPSQQVINIPGQSPQYIPGQPGQVISTYRPGSPPQYIPGQAGMCSCPCQ